MNLDLIAMHGWAGDQRAWEPWRQAAASRGWSLHTGERGYGRQTPHAPRWPGEGGAARFSNGRGYACRYRRGRDL